jgi:beta-N-acetylhexosaminidase
MLSHIIYQQIDPEWPASLSRRIANVLLRDQMGFGGLVVTDDLDMGAIKKHYDIEIIIRRILLSNIDVALICHKGPNIEHAFEEIRTAMSDSRELRTSSERCVRRILEIKREYLT